MASAPPDPATRDTETSDPARDLRRFHLGAPSEGVAGLPPDHDLSPLLALTYRDTSRLRTDYPLFAPDPTGPAPSEIVDLGSTLQSLADTLGEERLVQDNVERVERVLRTLAAESPEPADARELLAAAIEAAGAAMELSEDDAVRWERLARRLVDALAPGRFLPLRPETPFDLLAHAVAAARKTAVEGFAPAARSGITLLRGLLGDDALVAENGAPSTSVLGVLGGQFIDPERLSKIIDTGAKHPPIDDQRRQRLAAEVTALETLLVDSPLPVCFAAGELAAGRERATWTSYETDDPCGAAAAHFDAVAEQTAVAIRAGRLARLLTDGRYEPARHDPWLNELDWRGFDATELAMLPTVAVLVDAEWLATDGLASLSSLLRSGRPVQIVVLAEPASQSGGDGYRFEPGYLGLAHREAFVSQTSVARPLHLAAAFRSSLAGHRTALHVVAAIDRDREPSAEWLRLAAALEGRAHPLFVYDPSAGVSWARRLDFTVNPAPDLPWPVETVDDASGEPQEIPFTFADYALLEPSLAPHFAEVPSDHPDHELAPLDEWLDMPADQAIHQIPFVRGASKDGHSCPLAITRRLAIAARDRLGFWQTLQELAGVRSEYADRAASQARAEAEARAATEREVLEARYRAEIDRARGEATREAADSMTAALLDLDVSVLAASPPSPGLALPTGSVDELAGALLELVTSTDGTLSSPPPPGAVDEIADQLLGLVEGSSETADPEEPAP